MKLPTPETWETQVALKGNKASTWEQLLGISFVDFPLTKVQAIGYSSQLVCLVLPHVALGEIELYRENLLESSQND